MTTNVNAMEYWVNKRTAKTHPTRNNVHIRQSGRTEALCGRELDPEMDQEQAKYWFKTSKPNKKKICKQCLAAKKKEEAGFVVVDLGSPETEEDAGEEYTFVKFQIESRLLKSRGEELLLSLLEELEEVNDDRHLLEMAEKIKVTKMLVSACENIQRHNLIQR